MIHITERARKNRYVGDTGPVMYDGYVRWVLLGKLKMKEPLHGR